MLRRMTTAPHPGRLIVLEGIDGAGTTTQRERLAAWLSSLGYIAHCTGEPSTGPVGRLIRSLLSATAEPFDVEAMALLFAADRRDHVVREFLPHLQAGHLVLCDRYLLSSLAYQTTAGVPRDLVWLANTASVGIATPDLTLLVDVDVDVAVQRRQRRGSIAEIYDDTQVQARVAATYRAEFARLAAHDPRCQVIAGNGTPDEVEALLRQAILPCLPRLP
jgi:dTMP kinase